MNTPLNVRLAREREEAARNGPGANEGFQRKLSEHIAMPDWEKRLLPLFLFKGTHPYRLRALWNLAYAMYLAEEETMYGGRNLIVPDFDHGKLTGLMSRPTHLGVRSIFGRMRGCKKLTDSISPAFTEYVEWLHPAPCVYVPVSLHATTREHAWWRLDPVARKKVFRLPEPKPEERSYPYVTNQKTPEQQMVFDVYAMVPKSIPHEISGDLCQDLIVAVLCGETTVENIPNVIAAYASKARKIMPDRWRHVSLDDVIPGTDDMRYIETLAAPEQEEECEEHGFGSDCY